MSLSTHDHIAIDTNIVLRFLLLDDPAQTARVQKLIRQNRILLLTTVIMETEWVLRSAYKYSRHEVIEAFYELFGMKHVRLDQPEIVANALAGYENGLDFADALHLAAASGCKALATFDQKFIQKADALPGVEIIEPQL